MGEHEAPDRHPLRDALENLVHGGDDHADWDVTKHGRMADHATGPEGEPATEPWSPS